MRLVPKRLKTYDQLYHPTSKKKKALASKKSTSSPKYWTVSVDIITKINKGIYVEGEKLPSMRSLAQSYGVGLQVIQLAIAGLENLGYVQAKPKSGIYITNSNPQSQSRRIGIFLNNFTITNYALLIHRLSREMKRYNYELLVGSNFGENFGFEDWVKGKNLDGIFFEGIVDEELMQSTVKLNIPYLVLGNYDIDPKHPQLLINVFKYYYDFFKDFLPRFKGKRIAYLFGEEISRADREKRAAVSQVITEINGFADESILIHCDDGYEQMRDIIQNNRADVICVAGCTILGCLKYLNLHEKPSKSPYICIESGVGKQFMDFRYLVNYTYYLPVPDHNYKKAVQMMIKMVESRKKLKKYFRIFPTNLENSRSGCTLLNLAFPAKNVVSPGHSKRQG